jgi:NAD(P)-dependent dehydrogenase (short-subunit alcohol dehydrogenase family)
MSGRIFVQFVTWCELIRRSGQGVDLAHLPMYLASDASSWVIGQNICVDGGVRAGWRYNVENDRIAALYT